jgi:hypothetical protein
LYTGRLLSGAPACVGKLLGYRAGYNYQRFAPQDPDGRMDLECGIRQFVVGTVGKSYYEIRSTLPNREVQNDKSYGF